MTKDGFFTSIVIFSGVIAAFAFYAFWHAEDKENTSLKPQKTEQKNNIIKDRLIEEEIQKSLKKQEKQTLALPLNKNIQNENSIDSPRNIPYNTHESMQQHTQEIYDNLKPSSHEETIEEASITFEALDAHVQKMDEKLNADSEYMQKVAIDNAQDEERIYEMELPSTN